MSRLFSASHRSLDIKIDLAIAVFRNDVVFAVVSVAAKLGTSFAGPGGRAARELIAAEGAGWGDDYTKVWRGGMAVIMLEGRKSAGGDD